MKKFEYHLLNSKSSTFSGIDHERLQVKLNQLGLLGWEIFSTANLTSFGTTTSLLITLKRELPG